MQDAYILIVSAGAGLAAGAAFCFLHRRFRRPRLDGIERQMKSLAEDVLQMAELQMEIFHRVTRDLAGLEERVLDLTVPSADPSLPLEKRHQVLTLARKGVELEEISRRLNIPRGEAELVMNLKRYLDGRETQNTAPEGGRRYAPVPVQ